MKENDDKKRERQRKAKKRKALSRIRKALSRAEQLTDGDEFSEWENEFASSLEEKLETFDSAFVDPEKGRPGEALSYRQAIKLKEIEDKAKGKKPKQWKSGNGFKSKSWNKKSAPTTPSDEHGSEFRPESKTKSEPQPSHNTPSPRAIGKPRFRVIEGGKN